MIGWTRLCQSEALYVTGQRGKARRGFAIGAGLVFGDTRSVSHATTRCNPSFNGTQLKFISKPIAQFLEQRAGSSPTGVRISPPEERFVVRRTTPLVVIAGLDPAIPADSGVAGMPGSSPGMTRGRTLASARRLVLMPMGSSPATSRTGPDLGIGLSFWGRLCGWLGSRWGLNR
jgi:hypothetical protein